MVLSREACKYDINEDNTDQWLRNSELKVETEGFILSAQDY